MSNTARWNKEPLPREMGIQLGYRKPIIVTSHKMKCDNIQNQIERTMNAITTGSTRK
jgi:hypothetical protein